jgi:hypothetical protein
MQYAIAMSVPWARFELDLIYFCCVYVPILCIVILNTLKGGGHMTPPHIIMCCRMKFAYIISKEVSVWWARCGLPVMCIWAIKKIVAGSCKVGSRKVNICGFILQYALCGYMIEDSKRAVELHRQHNALYMLCKPISKQTWHSKC